MIAADVVPDWEAGYADGNVGGLVEAMLHPVGGFGKFLTVLLSLSVTANNAPTIYSLCLGSQTFIPPLVVVPRWVFSIVATAMYVHSHHRLNASSLTYSNIVASSPFPSSVNTSSTPRSPTSSV